MNRTKVRELKAQGVSLIVTVDNGISAREEIALAYQLGMEVIVTDHHEIHGELPEACAVIDPHRADCNYPFSSLAGVGVAFKLICAAEIAHLASLGREVDYLRDLCKPYLDLVAIGTVADVMPLIGENRLIVSMGLHLINQSPRIGIAALIEQAAGKGKRVSAQTISFAIAPRVNAAGRLASASLALELLLSESQTNAQRLACELCDLNKERQNEENAILQSAKERILALDALGDGALILDGDDWHPGIIGIVSSRITERYSRPSFLISYEGDLGKGSGRSVEGVNLVRLLSECSDLLVRFGGHEMAAGLSVERKNVPLLRKRMNDLLTEWYPMGLPQGVTLADCEITLADVTRRQIEELSILEPCGEGNLQPLFLLKNAVIHQMTTVGSGRHTRLVLKQGEKSVTAMYFGVGEGNLVYRVGDSVDLLVQMDLNEFNGNVTPQLLVRDMDLSLNVRNEWAKSSAAVCGFLSGNDGDCVIQAIPDRDAMVRVYQYLKRNAAFLDDVVSTRNLACLLLGKEETDWMRLCLALAVFDGVGLLSVTSADAGVSDLGSRRGAWVSISVPKREGKVNLEDAELYRRMQRLIALASCNGKENPCE